MSLLDRLKMARIFTSTSPFEVKIKVKKGWWTWPANSIKQARAIIKDARGSGLKGKSKIIRLKGKR